MGFRLAYKLVNQGPTDLNATAPLTIAENQPVGTVVGEFNATDPDANATLTYHLVSGAGDGNNSLFTLETNGTLKTATTFDYESNASTYAIRVQVKDEQNATVEGNFTITLTDDTADNSNPNLPVYAIKLTGDDASISLAKQGFGVGAGAWTFEFWIKPHNEFEGDHLFVQNENYSVNALRLKYFHSHSGGGNTGKIDAYYYPPNFHNYSSSILNTVWHHVAINHTGTLQTIFVNGNSESSISANFNISASSNTSIGRPSGYSSYKASPVYLGPIRYSNIARYSGAFVPQINWAIDANTIAQYLTTQPFDGTTLVDEAGGNKQWHLSHECNSRIYEPTTYRSQLDRATDHCREPTHWHRGG